MAEQGKQMRVGACNGFACNSVELVLLANGYKYDVGSNVLFLSGNALNPLKSFPCPTLTSAVTHLYL